MEETLLYMFSPYSKSEFGYLFKDGPSQFLSDWESGEPVFCREDLIFPPFKKSIQKPDLQLWP